MALIGFWHGANWTFIVFGFYWGCVIALYLYKQERSMRGVASARRRLLATRISDALSVASMFIVACIGWVFFRSVSLADAWLILSGMLAPSGERVALSSAASVALLWTLVGGLWIAELARQRWPAIVHSIGDTPLRRYAVRYALLVSTLFVYVAMQGSIEQPFIYFLF